MFISIPVFLNYLGNRDYGIWTLANSTLGLVGAVGLSFGDATTRYVARYSSEGDYRALAGSVVASLVLYASAGAVFTGALWALAPVIVENLFHLSGDEATRGVVAFRFAGIGLIPSASMNAVLGVFDGMQLFRSSQLLTMLRSCAVLALGIPVLMLGLGLRGLVAANVVTVWIVWVAALWLGLAQVRRMYAGPLDTRVHLRRVFSFSFASTLTNLGVLARTYVDKVVLGSLIGLEAVSYYSVSQATAQRIHAFQSSAAKVLMPFFSAYEANDSTKERLGSLMAKSWRVSVMLSLAVSVPVAASSPWLLTAWLGADFAQRAFAVFALSIAVWLTASFSIVPHYFLVGSGRPGTVAKMTVLAGGIYLALITIVAPVFGLTAATATGFIYSMALLGLGVSSARMCPKFRLWEGIVAPLGLPISTHLAAVGISVMATRTMLTRSTSPWIGVAMSSILSLGCLVAVFLLMHRSRNEYFRDAVGVVRSISHTAGPRALSLARLFRYPRLSLASDSQKHPVIDPESTINHRIEASQDSIVASNKS